MRKITFLLITIALSSLLSFTAQAQDENTTYGVYGYPIGISELEHTDSLTTSQKDSIEIVKNRLDEIAAGLTFICKDFNVDADAYSDYHPFKGVSPAQSDLLNDRLAWDRLRKALRYLIDVKGVPEDCFNIRQPVYADSQVRGVRFRLTRKKLPTAGGVDEGVIAEINQKISDLETDLDQLREEMEEKNEEQDEQIAENSEEISENSDRLSNVESRLSALESQVGRNVSAYVSVATVSFGGQTAPAFEAGTRHGNVRLSGWFGYWPDYTVNSDEGPRDFDRMLAGASVTWYMLNTRYVDAGPSIGAQWTHDEIDPETKGVDCRFIYYSALIGADVTANIGPVDLFGNISWSPTKEIIRGDVYRNTNPLFIKAGLRLNFN